MIDGGMTTLNALWPLTGCHVQFWCCVLMLKRVLVLGYVSSEMKKILPISLEMSRYRHADHVSIAIKLPSFET